jgi:hypothetical protein
MDLLCTRTFSFNEICGKGRMVNIRQIHLIFTMVRNIFFFANAIQRSIASWIVQENQDNLKLNATRQLSSMLMMLIY